MDERMYHLGDKPRMPWRSLVAGLIVVVLIAAIIGCLALMWIGRN